METNKNLEKTFIKIIAELEGVHKELEGVIPLAFLKHTRAFGNSSHVILPKSLMDEKVGVVVLKQKSKGVGKG